MKIAPSILSSDFLHLGDNIKMLNQSAAHMIHLDVMDGVFVPNISFGFDIIRQVASVADKPLDCHLMITDPGRYVSQVRDAGVTIMNVHQEACTHLHRTIQAIRAAGMRPAVTLNPATPVVMLEDIICDVDMVLLMSVNPGFGGQAFIPVIERKVRQLRHLIEQSGSKAEIEVDGGVNLATGRILADAGADILVAGNAVFKAADPMQMIEQLSEL